ncbi:HlyD family type I secretion periplasmic adaptor subunit [Sphingobium fuliginis]|jgi:HlyD family secretion protein|uniref:Membrane fusion protein (MFP) family protein n=1 Tax=Sphingobium fuliginis (strain ATCC 27551) TaxID=336203 RepID=A0A292ZBX5_SPHSA|nr:HlyD family type I secretion periplasmic adaptor subunit [Sphingobium fuliginis]QOT71254.1 HlyD family type I secretion periplasmic adaptor subunit [Sphingobium fuliginis]GAY20285.1 probable Co/Zn/Cd efflux system membrane fusion protein [Sphingobium fuliginis]
MLMRTTRPLLLPPPGPPPPVAVDPRPEVRGGLLVAAAFFLLFLGWAAFARLDAAALAPGRTTVAGQRQSVQHRDGGIVAAILVKEGQRVRQGEVLIRLAAPAVAAQERVLASQAIWLIAQRARLRAEQAGAGMEAPVEFRTLTGDDRADAQAAMRAQQAQMAARSALLGTQQGVAMHEGSQAGSQAMGYREQVASVIEQERLITDELESLRTVAEKGFVSKTRIRALERARADLIGQRGRLSAARDSAANMVGEARLKALEAKQNLQEKVTSDLRDTEALLGDVLPKWSAARDELARTQVRAPVSGTVVGLSVHTVGGVIAAGQTLMDIVPRDSAVVIEARFSPADVDDLAVGQKAEIRFAGFPGRSLPIIEGKVTRISADSFVEEKTGIAYFAGEVTIAPDQIALIRQYREGDFAMKPGMPVEVVVPLRRRTALQYMIDPLADTMWRSFREQ